MNLNFLNLMGIYEDTPENFVKVFKKCQEELLIATDFNPEFFENDSVLSTITELVKKGIRIQLIYSSEANLEKVPRIKRIIEKGYILAKPFDGLTDYFIVGDGWRYRANGYINRASFEKARVLRAQFDRMWDSQSHGSNLYQRMD